MFKKNSSPQPKGQNNHRQLSRGRLRIVAVVFCAVFVFGSVFSTVIFKPKPAQAIFGIGDVSITAGDIPRTITGIIDKIATVAWEGLKELALAAAYNAIDNYVQNLAYESAVYLATGDAGKKPLIYSQPFGKALLSVGDAVLGDFLDRLSTDIIGHSLCEPLDPRFNLQLAILLEGAQKPPKPKCSLNDIYEKGILGTVQNVRESGLGFNNLQLDDVIKFGNYFDPTSNNLGMLIEADRELRKEIKKKQALELEAQKIEGQFRSLRTTISGDVKTPASLIKEAISNVGRTASDKAIPAKTLPESSSV